MNLDCTCTWECWAIFVVLLSSQYMSQTQPRSFTCLKQRRLVTDAFRSRQFPATFLDLACHKLHSRTQFLMLQTVKDISSFNCYSQRLNHIAVLSCHREQSLDLEEICNNFIVKNDIRRSTFLNSRTRNKLLQLNCMGIHSKTAGCYCEFFIVAPSYNI